MGAGRSAGAGARTRATRAGGRGSRPWAWAGTSSISPPGSASWWRAFVQLGADVDVARGRRWAVVLGAGALGGVVSIAGAGFTVDRATRSIDLGGEGRARLEARLGRLRPWLGAAVAVWARRQALEIQGAATSSALPRVEPMAALGGGFRLVM